MTVSHAAVSFAAGVTDASTGVVAALPRRAARQCANRARVHGWRNALEDAARARSRQERPRHDSRAERDRGGSRASARASVPPRCSRRARSPIPRLPAARAGPRAAARGPTEAAPGRARALAARTCESWLPKREVHDLHDRERDGRGMPGDQPRTPAVSSSAVASQYFCLEVEAQGVHDAPPQLSRRSRLCHGVSRPRLDRVGGRAGRTGYPVSASASSRPHRVPRRPRARIAGATPVGQLPQRPRMLRHPERPAMMLSGARKIFLLESAVHGRAPRNAHWACRSPPPVFARPIRRYP